MSVTARLALLSAVLVGLFVVFRALGVVSREEVQSWIEPLGGWGAPVYAVLAALLGMAVGRRAGEVHGRARDFVERRGLLAVVLQRLAPGLPDAPFNYVAGSIGVRARDLALGTAIGVAPRALAYTALGSWIWS
jgi:uncharacterized membrane protein YdjX (TVP38/TMEM64 family)